MIQSVQIRQAHQADGTDDHISVGFRRLLLLPEQVPDHRPRLVVVNGPFAFVVVLKAPVIVDEALAKLVPLLGQAGEPLPRPPEVQQPQKRQEVLPVC
jgi:hypothetical protein